MMLKKSTTTDKFFHFLNHCHGYEDIHDGKEK